jgi:hypothetical protein
MGRGPGRHISDTLPWLLSPNSLDLSVTELSSTAQPPGSRQERLTIFILRHQVAEFQRQGEHGDG